MLFRSSWRPFPCHLARNEGLWTPRSHEPGSCGMRSPTLHRSFDSYALNRRLKGEEAPAQRGPIPAAVPGSETERPRSSRKYRETSSKQKASGQSPNFRYSTKCDCRSPDSRQMVVENLLKPTQRALSSNIVLGCCCSIHLELASSQGNTRSLHHFEWGLTVQ